jgi:hypothetical protein
LQNFNYIITSRINIFRVKMPPTPNEIETTPNDIKFLINLILDFAIEMGLKINKNAFKNINITKAIKIVKQSFKKIKSFHKKIRNKKISNSKKLVPKQLALQNSTHS